MRGIGQQFFLAMLVLALAGAGILLVTAVAQDDLLPPADLIPSRPVGEEIFQQNCGACHPTTDFDDRTWRHDTAPVEIAATVLGRDSTHPEAVRTLPDAWHATAYIWTIPVTPADVTRGIELVQYAQELAQNQGLLALLLHSGTIAELQDRAWVLTHTPADVEEHLRKIAGNDLETLTEQELAILVDHIFVAHFALPEGWR